GEIVGQVCGHREAREWKQAGGNREFSSGERRCCGESRHTSGVAARTGCGLSSNLTHRGHEVSLNQGRGGARISTVIIRPWRQAGHCCKEEPVSFSYSAA